MQIDMAALLMLTISEGLLLLSVCTVKRLQANRDANNVVILPPNNSRAAFAKSMALSSLKRHQ